MNYKNKYNNKDINTFYKNNNNKKLHNSKNNNNEYYKIKNYKAL